MATKNTEDAPTDETPVEETPAEEEVPMIMHRERIIDSNGVQHDKEHGPMPVSEWAEYERKHNL